MSDEKPGCRENNGVVIGDSRKVYLFGGYNGNAWLNDLWAFDIDTKRWSCIQTSSGSLQSSADDAANSATHRDGDNEVRPSRRFGYVSVVHSNKLVLFGGFDGSQWLNVRFVLFGFFIHRCVMRKSSYPFVFTFRHVGHV